MISYHLKYNIYRYSSRTGIPRIPSCMVPALVQKLPHSDFSCTMTGFSLSVCTISLTLTLIQRVACIHWVIPNGAVEEIGHRSEDCSTSIWQATERPSGFQMGECLSLEHVQTKILYNTHNKAWGAGETVLEDHSWIKLIFFLSSYVKSSKMECNAWLMLGKSIPGMSKYDKTFLINSFRQNKSMFSNLFGSFINLSKIPVSFCLTQGLKLDKGTLKILHLTIPVALPFDTKINTLGPMRRNLIFPSGVSRAGTSHLPILSKFILYQPANGHEAKPWVCK